MIEEFKGFSREQNREAVKAGIASPTPEFAAEEGSEMISFLREQIGNLNKSQLDSLSQSLEKVHEKTSRQATISEEEYWAPFRELVGLRSPERNLEAYQRKVKDADKNKLIEELISSATLRQQELTRRTFPQGE